MYIKNFMKIQNLNISYLKKKKSEVIYLNNLNFIAAQAVKCGEDDAGCILLPVTPLTVIPHFTISWCICIVLQQIVEYSIILKCIED